MRLTFVGTLALLTALSPSTAFSYGTCLMNLSSTTVPESEFCGFKMVVWFKPKLRVTQKGYLVAAAVPLKSLIKLSYAVSFC